MKYKMSFFYKNELSQIWGRIDKSHREFLFSMAFVILFFKKIP